MCVCVCGGGGGYMGARTSRARSPKSLEARGIFDPLSCYLSMIQNGIKKEMVAQILGGLPLNPPPPSDSATVLNLLPLLFENPGSATELSWRESATELSWRE